MRGNFRFRNASSISKAFMWLPKNSGAEDAVVGTGRFVREASFNGQNDGASFVVKGYRKTLTEHGPQVELRFCRIVDETDESHCL